LALGAAAVGGPASPPGAAAFAGGDGGAGGVAAGAAAASPGAGAAAAGIAGLAAVVAGAAKGGGFGNGVPGAVAGICAAAPGRGAVACGRGRVGAGLVGVCADAQSANAISGSSAARIAGMQRRNGQALVDADRATRRPPWLPHCSVFMSHPPKPPSTPTLHVNVTDRNPTNDPFNKRRYNVAGRKSSRIRPGTRPGALWNSQRESPAFSVSSSAPRGDQAARQNVTDMRSTGATP